MNQSTNGTGEYHERLWPAPWVWAVAVMFGAGIGIIMVRFGPAAMVTVAVVATAVLMAALARTTPEIAVAGGELRAGRARVPLPLTGGVTPLDGTAMRHEAGPGLDVRAYLCIRGWIRTGVRVDLTDPNDPTPYWLVSSRRPDELATALGAARRRSGG